MENWEIKKLCFEQVNDIFNDLIKNGLIDPEGPLFSQAKNKMVITCFQSVYPLLEFFNNFSESHLEFLLYSSSLFISAFFLDQSLDSLEYDLPIRTRTSQISTYLLFKYFEWVSKRYPPRIKSLFINYYKRQTDYLEIEKKWDLPQLYLSMYGCPEKIHEKEILLLFPLELCEVNSYFLQPSVIKELFVNYFSFILLADDIIDLSFDIHHRCLTYPIATYFKLRGKVPESRQEIIPIIPHIVKSLKDFLENVRKLEKKVGRNSLIIHETISHLKGELRGVGIEL
jgi:hypothetical protein